MPDNFEGMALKKALGMDHATSGISDSVGVPVQGCPHAPQAMPVMLHHGEGSCSWLYGAALVPSGALCLQNQLHSFAAKLQMFLLMGALPKGNNCMKAELILLLNLIFVLRKAVWCFSQQAYGVSTWCFASTSRWISVRWIGWHNTKTPSCTVGPLWGFPISQFFRFSFPHDRRRLHEWAGRKPGRILPKTMQIWLKTLLQWVLVAKYISQVSDPKRNINGI